MVMQRLPCCTAVSSILRRMQWHARWSTPCTDLPAATTTHHAGQIEECVANLKALGYEPDAAFLRRLPELSTFEARLKRRITQAAL